jgi:hypothetical protein
MKKLLVKFHQIDPANIELEIAYDLSALFSKIDYLNASAVASKAGISPLLLRQYISGFKYPSLERAKIIEITLHHLLKPPEKLPGKQKADYIQPDADLPFCY